MVRGLTLDDVGMEIGLTRHSIGNLEHSRRLPSYETLLALADFFDVSLDYLAGRTGNPKVNTDKI